MGTAEIIQGGETGPPKHTPGTLKHVEYLSDLPIPRHFNRYYVPSFFKETLAEKSLSILLKQQRTYRPIQSADIDFDSRLLKLQEPRLPSVRGTIHRDPSNPNNGHLTVQGQSQPWEGAQKNVAYGFFVPCFYDFTYDRSRPINASFGYEEEAGVVIRESYDELAAVEYAAADPRVLVKGIKQASSDFLTLMNYIYYGIEPQTIAQLEPSPRKNLDSRKVSPGIGWAAVGLAAGYWAAKATSRHR